MNRVWLLFIAALWVAAPALLVRPAPAAAQEEEARLLFERGNQHLARGLRARGARRDRELNEALDAYLGVLRLGARTRNVVFNLALTLEELGRDDEAFNYYSEYLRTFDLAEDERAEGQRRLDSIRERVAVIAVTSTPPGAEVRVDRRDLPVRGRTPIELAVPAGAHRVILTREGFEPATAEATATTGETRAVEVALSAAPVPVQVIAPSGGTLMLDGEVIVAGRAVPVAPGSHVVRLELPGAPPVERRFEVQAGAAPMVLELGAGSTAAEPGGTRLSVAIDRASVVYLDDLLVGRGSQIEIPVAPGEHRLRVEAPGANPATHELRVAGGEPLSLRVELGDRPSQGGLIAGRVITGVLATLGLAAGVTALVLANDAHEYWQDGLERNQAGMPGFGEAELLARAEQLERATLAVDLAWSITAVIGAVSVVLLAVDLGPGEESTVEVAASPAPGGGTLSASLRWGAL